MSDQETSTSHHVRLTPQSYVSIALVIVLVSAALAFGRQSQRVDSIESSVKEMRLEQKEAVREINSEIRAVRDLLQRQPTMTSRDR